MRVGPLLIYLLFVFFLIVTKWWPNGSYTPLLGITFGQSCFTFSTYALFSRYLHTYITFRPCQESAQSGGEWGVAQWQKNAKKPRFRCLFIFLVFVKWLKGQVPRSKKDQPQICLSFKSRYCGQDKTQFNSKTNREPILYDTPCRRIFTAFSQISAIWCVGLFYEMTSHRFSMQLPNLSYVHPLATQRRDLNLKIQPNKVGSNSSHDLYSVLQFT